MRRRGVTRIAIKWGFNERQQSEVWKRQPTDIGTQSLHQNDENQRKHVVADVELNQSSQSVPSRS